MERNNNILGEGIPGVVMLDERQIGVIFALQKRGWSIKAIARELGISRNTVRGWINRGGGQARPVMGRPRTLASEETWLHQQFKAGVRNGDVLRQVLVEKGVNVSLRTVTLDPRQRMRWRGERAVEALRQEARSADAATLRFETEPGKQLQIDFGEKWITVAGERVKAFVFVATLGYSRRTFARIYPTMRQQHWLEGLEATLQHFGGATEECVVDNAKALVLHWKDDVPEYHKEFEAFCYHWGMRPRACRPLTRPSASPLRGGNGPFRAILEFGLFLF